MSSAIIKQVASDSILSSWSSIEPLLQRVFDRIDSGHTTEDVLVKLQWGDFQLWNIDDWKGLAVTELAILPQHKNLNILYTAGDGVHEWMGDLVNALRPFAEENNCKYVEACGREGWKKIAKSFGVNDIFLVMRFNIDGQQRRW